jgi:hypothetical protein
MKERLMFLEAYLFGGWCGADVLLSQLCVCFPYTTDVLSSLVACFIVAVNTTDVAAMKNEIMTAEF